MINNYIPAIPAPKNLVAIFEDTQGSKIRFQVVAFDGRGTAMVANVEQGQLIAVDAPGVIGFSHLEWE